MGLSIENNFYCIGILAFKHQMKGSELKQKQYWCKKRPGSFREETSSEIKKSLESPFLEGTKHQIFYIRKAPAFKKLLFETLIEEDQLQFKKMSVNLKRKH